MNTPIIDELSQTQYELLRALKKFRRENGIALVSVGTPSAPVVCSASHTCLTCGYCYVWIACHVYNLRSEAKP